MNRHEALRVAFATLARLCSVVATTLVAEITIIFLSLPTRPRAITSVLGQPVPASKKNQSGVALPHTPLPWRQAELSGVERLRAHWAGWVSAHLARSEEEQLAGLVLAWCQDRVSWTVQGWKADAVGSRIIQFIRALPGILPRMNDKQRQQVTKVIWLHVRLLSILQYLEVEPLRRVITLSGLLAAQLAFGHFDNRFYRAEKRLGHLLAQEIAENKITCGLSADRVLRIYRECVRLRSLYHLAQVTAPPDLDTVIYRLEHSLATMVLADAGLVTFDGGDCDSPDQVRQVLGDTPAFQGPDSSRYVPSRASVRLVGQGSCCIMRIHEPPQSLWSHTFRSSGAIEFARHETQVLVTPQSYRDPKLYRSITAASAHNTVILEKASSNLSQIDFLDHVTRVGDSHLQPTQITSRDRDYSYVRYLGLCYQRWGLSYVRELQLCNQGHILLGKDTMGYEGERPRLVFLHFFLGADVEVQAYSSQIKSGEPLSLRLTQADENWEFSYLGDYYASIRPTYDASDHVLGERRSHVLILVHQLTRTEPDHSVTWRFSKVR